MKIFISWSGERSRLIAEALKIWLPDVISYFEPWVSSEDIEKGARWGIDLGHQLKDTDVGIICLTTENLIAPWILFEAGTLAKAIDRSRVCTYLYEIAPGELKGPLVQFQATRATEIDTFKLLQTLNNALGDKKRTDTQLTRAYKQWWPELKKVLDKIPKNMNSKNEPRSDRDILEELLDLVRQQIKGSSFLKSEKIFNYIPFLNLFQNKTITEFAKSVKLDGSSKDLNSQQWTRSISSDAIVDSHGIKQLEGIWSSRWNEWPNVDRWYTGIASILTHRSYVILIHSDPDYEYFMFAQKDKSGRLVGFHYNLNQLDDASPWVGLIVNNKRIDGQWKGGRWDLQRQ